jgi:hypothetical protein
VYNFAISNKEGEHKLGFLAQTYDYTYTTTSSDLNRGEATGLLALIGAYFAFVFVVWIVAVIALWKVFVKAGVEGWKSLIPFYNGWVLMEIAGKPGWWALVGLGGIIPVLGFIASIASIVLWILAALELGKAFGKDTTFSVVALIIFSLVGLLILGFGDAKYTKPGGAASSGGAKAPVN